MSASTPDENHVIYQVLDRHLRSIWEGDIATYQATTSEDVSFYEWYIAPQRIDGIDFHVRELAVHRQVLVGEPSETSPQIQHEILQPRLQIYGHTAIITYTLMLRVIRDGETRHISHHETRVFHDFSDSAEQEWRLVHCHKSPIATAHSLAVLRH